MIVRYSYRIPIRVRAMFEELRMDLDRQDFFFPSIISSLLLISSISSNFFFPFNFFLKVKHIPGGWTDRFADGMRLHIATQRKVHMASNDGSGKGRIQSVPRVIICR